MNIARRLRLTRNFDISEFELLRVKYIQSNLQTKVIQRELHILVFTDKRFLFGGFFDAFTQ